MRLFAENPDQQIDEFSAEFERGFIETLNYRHGTKRVQANRVYQEYIGDKHHIHMNATIWTSLTEICKYLGKEGKATVDETEKGWFIQYIDRDPRLLAKQAAMDQRKTVEYDEEERTKRAIDQQIAAAALAEQRKRLESGIDSNDVTLDENVATDLTREEGQKIEIALGTKAGAALKRPLKLVSFGTSSGAFEGCGSEPPSKRSSSFLPNSTQATATVPGRTAPVSAMEQIMLEEERKKQIAKQREEKSLRHDYWLQPGIVVKIMNKKVGEGKYYKQKGVVLSVIDRYVGEVSVLECNTVLRIDQEHLETVIPKVRSAMVL
jgi:DNA/RNA-binding protein KIN17